METLQYQRKPQIVDAVRVTEENFLDVTHWCQGAIVTPGGVNKSLSEIQATKDKHIRVRVVNPQKARHSKAFVGDWVLYSEYHGYKVYSDAAFRNSFLPVPALPQVPASNGHSGKSVNEAVEELRAKENADA